MDTPRNWEDCASETMTALIRQYETWAQETQNDDAQKTVDDLKLLVLEIPPKRHILASPLFEVSSLTIQPATMLDLPNLEISGHIKLKLYDINNHLKEKKFVLFERSYLDREIIPLSGDQIKVGILERFKFELPQVPPYGTNFFLELYLKDHVRDIEFSNEFSLTGLISKSVYDEERAWRPKRETPSSLSLCGVSVQYTMLRCGIIAFVNISISRNDGSKSTRDVVVKGTISARSTLRDMSEISRVLFDGEEDMVIGSETELCFFAVPAYSPLRIDVTNFIVGGEKIESVGGLQFEPNDLSEEAFTEEILSPTWCIKVGLYWRHPFLLGQDDESSEIGRLLSDDGDVEGEKRVKKAAMSVKRKHQGKSKDGAYQYHPPALPPLDTSDPRVLRVLTVNSNSRELVEVFSVAIGFFRCDDNPVQLYGTIECSNFNFRRLIFNKSQTEPVVVKSHQTLVLEDFGRHIRGPHFGMRLDLKDASGGEICNGYLRWSDLSAPEWLDDRICSVMSGKEGFACVHYTMFKYAVIARPRAVLWCDKGSVSIVRGSIRGFYSKYKYETQYDKEYYQSVLFTNDKSEPNVIVADGDALKLLKSEVAVPSEAFFKMEVNLEVQIGDTMEKLSGDLTFHPTVYPCTATDDLDDYSGHSLESEILAVHSLNCSLDVTVVWC